LLNHLKLVELWACNNKLIPNLNKKNKEIVFKKPSALHFHVAPFVDDVEWLDCVKLTAVLFRTNLKTYAHLQHILSQRAKTRVC